MKTGGILFLIGLVLAIIVALFSAGFVPVWVFFVLAVLGLIVGLLNVTQVESQHFLVAGIAFLLSFQALSNVVEALAFGWDSVGVFFSLLTVYVAPAIAVVGIKALFKLAKN